MFPGLDPRQMQKMMKQLGVKQDTLEATEVIIKTDSKELIFRNPEVTKVNMMGQDTYQIVGRPIERSISKMPEISEEDVKTVAEQANVSDEEAKEALVRNKGDIAASILELTAE
ncbi:MAG: nascent polypeptide-associated complex protein [Candidatus Woesearchaeota archaeon]|jgi:nascent polypeptide-associated complex subunit alpha